MPTVDIFSCCQPAEEASLCVHSGVLPQTAYHTNIRKHSYAHTYQLNNRIANPIHFYVNLPICPLKFHFLHSNYWRRPRYLLKATSHQPPATSHTRVAFFCKMHLEPSIKYNKFRYIHVFLFSLSFVTSLALFLKSQQKMLINGNLWLNLPRKVNFVASLLEKKKKRVCVSKEAVYLHLLCFSLLIYLRLYTNHNCTYSKLYSWIAFEAD
jgi:hypothetical protein